jgi:hypothetical protein
MKSTGCDAFALRLGEAPRFVGGDFAAEVGVQIPHGLLQASWNVSSHGGSLGRTAEERVHSGFPVALPVALGGRDIQLAHDLPVRNGGQSSFQQGERVDAHWGVGRELQRNGSTIGVANDVRRGHVQVFQQRAGIGCLFLDAHQSMHRRAAEEASTVITDERVPLRQC